MGAAKKGARKRRIVRVEQSLNRNILVVEGQQVQTGQHPCGSVLPCPVDIDPSKASGKQIKPCCINAGRPQSIQLIATKPRHYLILQNSTPAIHEYSLTRQ